MAQTIHDMGIAKLINNQNLEITQKRDDAADRIYIWLNQGNLFRIYQIMDSFENAEERKQVIRAFIKKYEFNFLKHI